MLFIPSKKLFLVWWYLNFNPNLFSHVGKRLDKKAMVDFKICGVSNLETNNYNTDVAQFLKK